MVSKKEMLILGTVAIAGTGVGLMMLDKDREENGGDVAYNPFEGIWDLLRDLVRPPTDDHTEDVPSDITPGIPPDIPPATPPDAPPDIPPNQTKKYYHTEQWRAEQRVAGVHDYLTLEQQASFDRGERVSVSMTPVKKQSKASKARVSAAVSAGIGKHLSAVQLSKFKRGERVSVRVTPKKDRIK